MQAAQACSVPVNDCKPSGWSLCAPNRPCSFPERQHAQGLRPRCTWKGPSCCQSIIEHAKAGSLVDQLIP